MIGTTNTDNKDYIKAKDNNKTDVVKAKDDSITYYNKFIFGLAFRVLYAYSELTVRI